MQAQNEFVAKKGMLSSFVDIYSKEGIAGLWRVSENCQRINKTEILKCV